MDCGASVWIPFSVKEDYTRQHNSYVQILRILRHSCDSEQALGALIAGFRDNKEAVRSVFPTFISNDVWFPARIHCFASFLPEAFACCASSAGAGVFRKWQSQYWHRRTREMKCDFCKGKKTNGASVEAFEYRAAWKIRKVFFRNFLWIMRGFKSLQFLHCGDGKRFLEFISNCAGFKFFVCRNRRRLFCGGEQEAVRRPAPYQSLENMTSCGDWRWWLPPPPKKPSKIQTPASLPCQTTKVRLPNWTSHNKWPRYFCV